jgi:co-chaperonin GroES (HSP10)
VSLTQIDIGATQEKVEGLASRLPNPKGFQLLGIKPKIETTTEAGIVKPDAFLHREEAGSVVVMVLEVGDMAYKDETRFPTGPWAKVGDFVLLGAYRGSRFSVDGQEFVIFADDMVLATVDDPRGINRAY